MGSVMRMRMDRSKRQELPVWAIMTLAVIMIGTMVWVIFG